MHLHICYIKHSTVQSILYTIYYICIYILSIYICLHILYTHMPIFLLFSNSFEATQRNALICCSVHFIPLLIRPCAARRPHIHWLTHTSIHTYLNTYMYIHICMSRDPAFAMVAALGFTYYTYGTLVVPVPLPLYLCQCLSLPPPAPLPQAYSNPACTHSTLSRTSTWTRTRAWSPSPSASPTQQLLLSSLFVMLASCDRHNFSFFSSNIRTHI